MDWNAHGRPNGLDINNYEGYENWTPKQWAWEFLRRNTLYAGVCRELELDPSEKEAALSAKQFGLLKLKPPYESYASISSQPPKFLVDHVRTVIARDDSPRAVKWILQNGEIALRVDLVDALRNRQCLEAKLKAIEAVIKKQLLVLESKKQLVGVRRRIKDHGDWLALIRLLDAAAAKKQTEAASILFESKMNEMDESKQRKFIHGQYRRAKNLAETGYRHVVIWNPV